MAEKKPPSTPSALNLAGLGLEVGGRLLSGDAASRANRAARDAKRALEASAGRIGRIADPIRETLTSGFGADGFLRDALKAEGRTRAQQASIDALTTARGLGSRTSARAQAITFDDLTRDVLARAGVEEQADITSQQALAQIGLDELGFGAEFNRPLSFDPLSFSGELAQEVGGGLAQADFGIPSRPDSTYNTYQKAYNGEPITGPDGRVVAI